MPFSSALSAINGASTLPRVEVLPTAAIGQQNAQAAHNISGPSTTRDDRFRSMLKFLIDAGADPLIRDSNGYTATKYAAINDSVILFPQIFFVARQHSQSPTASEHWVSSP